MKRAGLALLLLGGCISTPSTPSGPIMCESSSDCDSGAGEVCDEGICWGDPPPVELAAILQPSGDGSAELARTEIPHLEISRDGTISGLQFVEPVHVQGKVTLFCSALTDETQLPCGPDNPIAATIRVERDAGFPGGPRFRQTFTTQPGEDGEPAFDLTLPPTLPDEDGSVRPYRIAVAPAAPDAEATSAQIATAALAPPVALPPFEVTSDTAVEWKLGDPETHRWVSSCLRAGAGFPDAFKDLSVTALAPSPETGDLVAVSSTARTDEQGCFSIRVPVDLQAATLRFRPGSERPDPTVVVADEPLPAGGSAAGTCYPGSPEGSLCIPNVRGPDLVVPASVTVPIVAQSTGGGTTPVAGAAVRFYADVPVPMDADNPDRTGRVSAAIDVRASSSASSEDLGEVTTNLRLNLTYQVSVIPGSDAKEAALIGHPMSIENPGVQQAIELGRRIAVVGKVVDSHGVPVEAASITAEPSVSYRLSQDADNQPLVETLSATATTTASGDFILWIDGPLDLGSGGLGDPVIYNLQVTPPFLSAAPLWRFEGVYAEGTDSLSLGELQLPPAAFARGLVTGPDGTPTPNVEVHIWEPDSSDPCEGAANSPSACPAAARRWGVWLSDPEDSVVRVVLPDP